MRPILLVLLLPLSSCWMLRAYKVRKLQLTDHQKLPSVPVAKPAASFHFIQGKGNPSTQWTAYLDTVLPHTETAAFLVVRNDSILYERYFNGFHAYSLLPSNSMAKSFTGTLAGIALAEGSIRSEWEPVTVYLPELLKRDTGFRRITIRHLLDMRSGLDFNEGSYDLKDDAIRLAFRRNVQKHLFRIRIKEPPGRFRYQSVNTQLLALVVERATGRKLNVYLEEKLWKALGAESAATWNTDAVGQVLGSAGLNAIARDFAKLGRLYLQNGNWSGRQVIPEQWVQQVASLDSMLVYGAYKNQWWSRSAGWTFGDSTEAAAFREHTPLSSPVRSVSGGYEVAYRTGAFHASGFLNQVIYVHPRKGLLIVRIGRRWQFHEPFVRFIYNLGERL